METNFLLASAFITFILAILLLFLPKILKSLDELGNRTIFEADAKEERIQKVSGFMLILAGAILLLIKQFIPGRTFPDEIAWINLAAWLGLILGIITIFMPKLIIHANLWGSKHIFSANHESSIRRNILGIILMMIAIYIFYILVTGSSQSGVSLLLY